MSEGTPSPNLYISFRNADTVSEEDVRGWLEPYGPTEVSVPNRKPGDSRLCFATFESEAKATQVLQELTGAQLKGERVRVNYNNNAKDTRRKTTGGGPGAGGFNGGGGGRSFGGGGGGSNGSSGFGGGGGGGGLAIGSSGFAGSRGGGGSGFAAPQRRNEDSRFGSQSSLNRAGAGDAAARPAGHSSGGKGGGGGSQFYAEKDIDLAGLVIKVETAGGARHIELQSECFNLMKQFMSAEELDSGIRQWRCTPAAAAAAAPAANGSSSNSGGLLHGATNGGGRDVMDSAAVRTPQSQPVPIAAQEVAPVALTNGHRQLPAAKSASPAATAPPPPVATVARRVEPPRLARGDRRRVKLIEFASVSQFTVVDLALIELHHGEVDALLTRLYNRAGPAGEALADPRVGDCVCAVWQGDGHYYRSVVREATGASLSVFFLDEGSLEAVQAGKIRTLTPELAAIPSLAFICRLEGVPSSEHGRISAKLAAADFLAELEVVQCNGFELSVRLHLNGACLNDAPAAAAAAPAAAAAARGPPAARAPATFSLPARQLELNSEREVLAVEVNSTAEIGLMLPQCQADYQAVSTVLAGINSGGGGLQALPALPAAGTVCLARWLQDGNFYRARVLRTDVAAGKCRLFFLDEGNTDLAGLDQLVALPDALKAIPPVALHCRSAASAATLAKPVAYGDIMVAVFSGPGRDDEDADFVLASLKFAADRVDAFEPAAAPAPVAPAIYKVRIIQMNSPVEFWVQRIDQDEELASFGAELDTYCKRSARPLQPGEVKPTAVVGAPFLGQYFRAEVRALSDSGVEVYFLDYGNVDTVAAADLRALTDAHRARAPMALLCRLRGLAPPGGVGQPWPADTQTVLAALLGGDTGELHALGPVDAQGAQPCDLVGAACASLVQALLKEGKASALA